MSGVFTQKGASLVVRGLLAHESLDPTPASYTKASIGRCGCLDLAPPMIKLAKRSESCTLSCSSGEEHTVDLSANVNLRSSSDEPRWCSFLGLGLSRVGCVYSTFGR
ncbi:hypothetical protein B296_00030048 [Ensete ventricosum]|uniref:Uncharacterized protein n=1 Tax=Ensete ventricosum TaxID=4639 RepID=A0A426ZJH4_ENSVE|nr:hypothetical protein B296_00030048 [Ensete ventricosum]